MATMVFQDIQQLADRAPALSRAINKALASLAQRPSHQEVQRMRKQVTPLLLEFHAAAINLKQLAVNAEQEHKTTVTILERKISELQAEISEWQSEYEPDADPFRPAFFSNLRRAFAVFFSSATR